MYGLVTYIAEVLGGKKWEELVQSKIFDPLGMTSSTFASTADWQHIDLAKGYIDRNGTLIPVPFEYSRYLYNLIHLCSLIGATPIFKQVSPKMASFIDMI